MFVRKASFLVSIHWFNFPNGACKTLFSHIRQLTNGSKKKKSFVWNTKNYYRDFHSSFANKEKQLLMFISKVHHIYKMLQRLFETYQDFLRLTKTFQDLPRLFKTYKDFSRLTKACWNLPRLFKTYRDLPRLTKTFQE